MVMKMSELHALRAALGTRLPFSASAPTCGRPEETLGTMSTKVRVVRCFVEGYDLFRHPNALHSKLKALNPKPQHPRRASGFPMQKPGNRGAESQGLMETASNQPQT